LEFDSGEGSGDHKFLLCYHFVVLAGLCSLFCLGIKTYNDIACYVLEIGKGLLSRSCGLVQRCRFKGRVLKLLPHMSTWHSLDWWRP